MSEVLQALGLLGELSRIVYDLQLQSEERLRAQHGRFNVFTTLLAAHDEVRLHTRFLHELLNPEGTHDCGDLFLKQFFDTLQDRKALDHDGLPVSMSWNKYCEAKYRAGKEVRTEQGQLDLLVESKSHLLVIENKIWAAEQDNQVARYVEYVKSQKEQSQVEEGCVLYLTLDGKRATTHDGNDYFRISYRDHIMAWLERCLQSTYNIVPINQVLIQYQKVVKQLTGQQEEAEIMDRIKKFIHSNPKIVSQRNATNQAIDQLRIEVLEKFAAELAERLSDSFSITPRTRMKNNSFGADDFGGLVIHARKNDIAAGHSFEIWVENCSRWDSLIIGIESSWQKDRPLNDEEKILLQRIRACCEGKIHCSEPGITETWRGTHWPIGWHDLLNGFMADDAEFAKMLDESHFQSQVKTAAIGVRAYMTLLEEVYQDACASKGKNE
jgi:PD-(D/E)XK nuclease superfamily